MTPVLKCRHTLTVRDLRTADIMNLLPTPRVINRYNGERSLSTMAPSLLHALPLQLRDAPSINSFKLSSLYKERECVPPYCT